MAQENFGILKGEICFAKQDEELNFHWSNKRVGGINPAAVVVSRKFLASAQANIWGTALHIDVPTLNNLNLDFPTPMGV